MGYRFAHTATTSERLLRPAESDACGFALPLLKQPVPENTLYRFLWPVAPFASSIAVILPISLFWLKGELIQTPWSALLQTTPPEPRRLNRDEEGPPRQAHHLAS